MPGKTACDGTESEVLGEDLARAEVVFLQVVGIMEKKGSFVREGKEGGERVGMSASVVLKDCCDDASCDCSSRSLPVSL